MKRKHSIPGIDRELDRTGREAAVERRNPPYHDLDHLAGALSRDEGDKLLHAMSKIRRIDPALWKNP